MSNFLNPDNAFFTTINKIIDVMWIGILWGICCIPLITIGPATTALYYTTVKVIRRDRSYATKQFFKAFKQNFKQGAIVSIIYLAFTYLMYIDFQYAIMLNNEGQTMGTLMLGVFLASCAFAVFILIWIYPVLSRFNIDIKTLFKNSLFISIKHLFRSLMMIAYLGGIGYLIYTRLPIQFYILIPVVLPGITCLLFSFIIEPVFKKYMGEAAGTPEETGEDQWYRE